MLSGVVEHDADVDVFVRRAGRYGEPGGLMIALHHQPELKFAAGDRRCRLFLAGCRADAPVVQAVDPEELEAAMAAPPTCATAPLSTLAADVCILARQDVH